MKMSKITHSIIVPAALLLLVSVTTSLSRPITNPTPGGPGGGGGPDRFPQPTTIDQIIHNKGNIVTTVDNWGYIGGYQYYDYPSGEWPRNSGHDYIGELKYWMGATIPAGDTLVANSYDDFQGMTSLIDGQPSYRILLSTDTTRYWGYDLTDTVGSGAGNPALGWRIWNPVTSQWEYNSSYNSLSASFLPGGPTSLQESHYRFNDQASGALLGIEVTHTILQWNYCYNEDFMFVILEITNRSTNDYADFAFGLYIDIDVGGPDGTGENGRLGDVVAYDTTENLAWTYDVSGYDPGWGGFPNGKTGVMGTKYLETPDNIGMTAFRSGDWAVVSNLDDPGMYDLINSTQFDASLPPTDQYYIQCTRGINLTAGRTVRVVYALIAGDDVDDFKANATAAQSLYDNFYVGPQPPPTPVLHARSADQKIYLDWTDTSEVSVDPMTQVNDFGGYKLYRSDNQGKTWGEVDNDNVNSCLSLDFERIAEFNVITPGDPIARSYIDTNLFNGVEYWYCLAAYDIPDTSSGVDALQSGFGIAGEVTNVIKVTPLSNPAGYFAAAGTVIHTYTGSGVPSEGTVVPTVFNVDSLLGAEYKVVFEDRLDDDTYWHLINVTTGDTILLDQTRMGDDPNLFEVVEGLRVVVTNVDRVSLSLAQTGFSGSDTTMKLGTDYGPGIAYLYGDPSVVWSDEPFRASYEFRYTGDSTLSASFLDWYYGTDNPYWVPFEVWNVTDSRRVSLTVWDVNGDNTWDAGEPLTIVDYPYDSVTSVAPVAQLGTYSWMFEFDATDFNPSVGDVFTVQGAPLLGPDDEYAFKVDGINDASARASMDDIRVVPNPYFASYSARIETSDGQSILEFQQVPGICTIRIYTLAGDLIRTIEHTDGTGTARWDLQSRGQRLIASGIYIYHVESEFGEHLGRFAVVK